MNNYTTENAQQNTNGTYFNSVTEYSGGSVSKVKIAEVAANYVSAGFSIIPVGKDKRSPISWAAYQKKRPSLDEVRRWFSNSRNGIAIITGKISGNLEVLDIDCKYDLSGSLMEDFCELITELAPPLLSRLVIARTINKGFYIIYRVSGESVSGNKKMASRPAIPAEAEGGDKVKVLIETRGEGGYFVAAPTAGYEFSHGNINTISLINDEERDLLFKIARSFDQMPVKDEPENRIENKHIKASDLSPFDDYNIRGDVPALLEKNAWQCVIRRGDRLFYKRPGKTESVTSANFHAGLRIFYVFSTSTVFESGRGYNPTGVYTILEHQGDFSAAGRELRSSGYGAKSSGKFSMVAATDSRTGPKVLPTMSISAPLLDEKLLPESWRVWLSDKSERLQCPLDYSAISALIACAALIGNKIRIRPKHFDSWLVIPNLWGGIVGAPGMMKTPAVNEGLIFFKEIAEKERLCFEKKLETSEFEKEFSEAKKSALKKEMVKARAGEKENFQQRFQDLQSEMPKEKRLWTADVTIEKLGELLNENADGLLICRDELTGWFRMLERNGHEQDRAFYLEAWNGEGSFTFDRIGRGKTHIKNLTVSVLGTIQPSMIEPYLRASLDGLGDDGLIQRFQMLVYPETVKNYRYVDRLPKGHDAARDSFKKMYAVTPADIGAGLLTEEAGGYSFLQFNEEAQEFFKSWLTGLENHLRSDTLATSALESHLAKYRSLMPSLALVFRNRTRICYVPAADALAGSGISPARTGGGKNGERFDSATIRRNSSGVVRLSAKARRKTLLDGSGF